MLPTGDPPQKKGPETTNQSQGKKSKTLKYMQILNNEWVNNDIKEEIK